MEKQDRRQKQRENRGGKAETEGGRRELRAGKSLVEGRVERKKEKERK